MVRGAVLALAEPTGRALIVALIFTRILALLSALIRTLNMRLFLACVRAPLGAGVRPALAGLAGIVVAFAHAGFSHAAPGMAICPLGLRGGEGLATSFRVVPG
jgi:hypothetical protein